jgi:hypothetical protein
MPSPVEAAAVAVRCGTGAVRGLAVSFPGPLSGARARAVECDGEMAQVSDRIRPFAGNNADSLPRPDQNAWTFLRQHRRRPVQPLSAGIDSMVSFWQVWRSTTSGSDAGPENGISRTWMGTKEGFTPGRTESRSAPLPRCSIVSLWYRAGALPGSSRRIRKARAQRFARVLRGYRTF